MDIKDLSEKLNLKRTDQSVGDSLACGCEFWKFVDYPDAWISNYDVQKEESTIEQNVSSVCDVEKANSILI